MFIYWTLTQLSESKKAGGGGEEDDLKGLKPCCKKKIINLCSRTRKISEVNASWDKSLWEIIDNNS